MEMERNPLEQARLEKIHRLRAAGVEPYPTRAEVTHTIAEAIQAFTTAEAAGATDAVQVTVGGRLRAMRPMGKITFAHIEDSSGRLQLFFRVNELGQEQMDFFAREFDLGDFIQASGFIFRTRTGEVTLHVESFKMLAKAITPLPAAKDEVVDGQVVRHATLADPEVSATASATPTWPSTPRYVTYSARAQPSFRPCANSLTAAASWR